MYFFESALSTKWIFTGSKIKLQCQFQINTPTVLLPYGCGWKGPKLHHNKFKEETLLTFSKNQASCELDILKVQEEDQGDWSVECYDKEKKVSEVNCQTRIMVINKPQINIQETINTTGPGKILLAIFLSFNIS